MKVNDNPATIATDQGDDNIQVINVPKIAKRDWENSNKFSPSAESTLSRSVLILLAIMPIGVTWKKRFIGARSILVTKSVCKDSDAVVVKLIKASDRINASKMETKTRP